MIWLRIVYIYALRLRMRWAVTCISVLLLAVHSGCILRTHVWVNEEGCKSEEGGMSHG